jgi:pilus assembly protein Flp/PilA
MRDRVLQFYVKLEMVRDESGQDLIEYVLVVALITLTATASMATIASSISNAFASIGTKLSTYTS